MFNVLSKYFVQFYHNNMQLNQKNAIIFSIKYLRKTPKKANQKKKKVGNNFILPGRILYNCECDVIFQILMHTLILNDLSGS